MITKATAEFPEIQWDWKANDILEIDPEERLIVYNAAGADENGNKYTGTAHFICNEIDEIKDITLVQTPPASDTGASNDTTERTTQE